MPGSGHLMSGQTIYLKMREANVIEDMLEINEKGIGRRDHRPPHHGPPLR
jgi:hypothetical protein